MTADALVVTNLSKSFSERPALIEASLRVRAGEIHALVGQNGCGKSTLIKVLAGYHAPDGHDAVIEVNGRRLAGGDPQAARAAGLRFIHQDLGLVAELSAVDNLALGESYEGRWWLSDRRERVAALKVMRSYGLEIDPDQPVHALSPARQTFLAIIRALRSGLGDGNILILDEPTAALPSDEVERLFQLLRSLRDRGVAIVLVTHRLSEVLGLADRVTVLRDGRTLETQPVAGLNHDALTELIIGRRLEHHQSDPTVSAGLSSTVLDVRDLTGVNVVDASISVHRGEIVGLAGVVGSGYENLLSLIFGAYPVRRGQVSLNGSVLANNVGACVRAGLGYVPADRKRLGAIMSWSLTDNVTLPSLPVWMKFWLHDRKEKTEASSWLTRLDVSMSSDRGFWTLSGGNQQRVVLAKWLRHGTSCLLIDEPSAGVDVGARQAIYAALTTAASSGTSLLIASSDAEELAQICDRVVVMREGRIGVVLKGEDLTADRIVSEGLRTEEMNHAA